MSTSSTLQQPLNSLNSFFERRISSSPPEARRLFASFLCMPIAGPGICYRDISLTVQEHATECYLAAFVVHNYFVETALEFNNVLTFAMPIFIVSEMAVLALLYMRAGLEIHLALDTPYPLAKENKYMFEYMEKPLTSKEVTHSPGSNIYKTILSKLRQPWNIYHTGLGVASLAVSTIIFPPTSYMTILLRLISYTPLAAFLWVKLDQYLILQNQRQQLEAWVKAAKEEEKKNRIEAQQRILRYLHEINNPPNIALSAGSATLSVQFSVTIPFNYGLDLANLQLTSLPDIIWHLPKLQTLNLEGNQLTLLSEKITNLPHLTTLNIRHNQLKTLPPELATLSKLTILQSTGNSQLTVPSEIASNPSIQQDSCVMQ